MPIFDYQCERCERIFDVFHRGKEDTTKIKCPSCGSESYKKLVSVPGAVGGRPEAAHPPSCDFAGTEGCCGGMCGLN